MARLGVMGTHELTQPRVAGRLPRGRVRSCGPARNPSRSAHYCEDAGFQTPARLGRPFLTVCPLCGGAVRWQGFNGKRWRALWERQKAEMVTSSEDGAA